MKRKIGKDILHRSSFCCLIVSFSCAGSPINAETIHAPDFSKNAGGYRVAGEGIILTTEQGPEPDTGGLLKITATKGNGRVQSPAFATRPTARTTRAVKGHDLSFWSVKYSLQNNLRRGKCRIRLRILDPDDPYEIGFEHFGGTETHENGFTRIHKPLCAIVSTDPHKRKAAGDNQAELIVELKDAEGDVRLSEVEIATAQPGGPDSPRMSGTRSRQPTEFIIPA